MNAPTPAAAAKSLGTLTPEQVARARSFFESCLRRKLRRQLAEHDAKAVSNASPAS